MGLVKEGRTLCSLLKATYLQVCINQGIKLYDSWLIMSRHLLAAVSNVRTEVFYYLKDEIERKFYTRQCVCFRYESVCTLLQCFHKNVTD